MCARVRAAGRPDPVAAPNRASRDAPPAPLASYGRAGCADDEVVDGHRRSDQPAGAERDHRIRACRRGGQGVRRGGGRGEGPGPRDARPRTHSPRRGHRAQRRGRRRDRAGRLEQVIQGVVEAQGTIAAAVEEQTPPPRRLRRRSPGRHGRRPAWRPNCSASSGPAEVGQRRILLPRGLTGRPTVEPCPDAAYRSVVRLTYPGAALLPNSRPESARPPPPPNSWPGVGMRTCTAVMPPTAVAAGSAADGTAAGRRPAGCAAPARPASPGRSARPRRRPWRARRQEPQRAVQARRSCPTIPGAG